MSSIQEIREWLARMEYPDPNISDETLQTLCKGALGPIFQQIIDRVKPRHEIERLRRAILLNRLTNQTKRNEDLKEIKMYEEKNRLEQELKELNEINAERELNLTHTIARVKVNNANIQHVKHEINEAEKEYVLYDLKCNEVDKQIKQLETYEEHLKFMKKIPENENMIHIKIESIMKQIGKIINENDQQITLNSTNPDLNEPDRLSAILNSYLKPLSTIKKNRSDFKSFPLTWTTIKRSTTAKKNSRRNNDSTLFDCSSSSKLSSDGKCEEVMNSIEMNCWSNEELRLELLELWQMGCEFISKRVVQWKRNRKQCLLEKILENDSKKSSNFDSGLEKLYAFHIEKEMEYLKLQQKQRKIIEMLNNKLVDVPELAKLESTECGLETTITFLQKRIKEMNEHIYNNNNTEPFNTRMNELKIIKNEINLVTMKLETNLRLLYDSNVWIKKSHKSVIDSLKKPSFHTEYDLLETNIAETDVRSFISTPILTCNSYLSNWNEIHMNPDLLKLIQHSYLTPDCVMRKMFEENNWRRRLLELLKHVELLNKFDVMNKKMEAKEEMDNISEKLQRSIALNLETVNNVNVILEREIELWFDSNLNHCVAPKVEFEGKTFKEYYQEFECVYKQLPTL